jgi:SAM-dependent methyltransferase
MEAYDLLIGELVEGYDHHFETYARLEADHFLSGLSPGCRILDLGCGVGTASRYFAEQGHTAISGDLSIEMLRECRRRGLTHLARLDLEALPFPNCAFEGVWAHTSLLHIPKHRLPEALEGIEKVLKPGGRLFIALREGETEGYERQSGRERWFANYRADEFESYIPRAYHLERSSRTDRQIVTFLNFHLVKVGKA